MATWHWKSLETLQKYGGILCVFFYGKVIYNLEMFRFKKSEFPASKAPYLMIGGCQIARFD
jgi:hypothetical protein